MFARHYDQTDRLGIFYTPLIISNYSSIETTTAMTHVKRYRTTHIRQFSIALLSLLLSTELFSETINIPLTENKGWEVLTYNNIKPNKLSFNSNELKIFVSNSASPIIYPLNRPEYLKRISFSVTISNNIALKEQLQGSKGNDDFVFRFGLVFEGGKTLHFFQRITAATWVKRLFDLNTKGSGVSNIDFYNIYSDTRIKDKQKESFNGLIIEHYLKQVMVGQEMQLSIPIENKSRVLALWISADGDDTHSTFEVSITDIKLSTATAPR